tara:strand:- start:360 stop:839 length:480 start_codon:yes stop_codon:yes gene_type:complete
MRFLKVFIFACFLSSCQNIEEVNKPDNLIPQDKMVEVLTELAILNSAKNKNKRTLEETGLQPDTYLYSKYEIDSLQLAESTTYYAKKYDQFDNIYQKVRQNLEVKKAKLEVIREEEQRIEDSIRTAATKDTLKIDSLKTPKTISKDSLVSKPQSIRINN